MGIMMMMRMMMTARAQQTDQARETGEGGDTSRALGNEHRSGILPPPESKPANERRDPDKWG